MNKSSQVQFYQFTILLLLLVAVAWLHQQLNDKFLPKPCILLPIPVTLSYCVRHYPCAPNTGHNVVALVLHLPMMLESPIFYFTNTLSKRRSTQLPKFPIVPSHALHV